MSSDLSHLQFLWLQQFAEAMLTQHTTGKSEDQLLPPNLSKSTSATGLIQQRLCPVSSG